MESGRGDAPACHPETQALMSRLATAGRAATGRTKPVARCQAWRLLTLGGLVKGWGQSEHLPIFEDEHRPFYYPAGTTAATADVGGTLPSGWRRARMLIR